MSSVRRSWVSHLLLLLLFVLPGGCSQDGWVAVNPEEQPQKVTWRTVNGQIEDIWSPDGLRLWAVGAAGLVLHSPDGGMTWESQLSGTTKKLTAVRGTADGRSLWAAGEYGALIRTQDGGRSWTDLHTTEREDFAGIVCSKDGRDLHVLSSWGDRYDSADAGNSWSVHKGTAPRRRISRVVSTGKGEKLLALAGVGDSALFESHDLGKTWQELPWTPPASVERLGVTLNSSDLWFVAGKNLWQATPPSSASGWKLTLRKSPRPVYALFASQAGLLWVGTEDGEILKYHDREWLRQRIGINPDHIAAGNNVFWVTESDGSVHWTLNRGVTWKSQETRIIPSAIYAQDDHAELLISGARGELLQCSPMCEPINSPGISFGVIGGSGQNIWAYSGDKLFLSADDGKSWGPEAIPELSLIIGFFRLRQSGDWIVENSGRLFRREKGRWELFHDSPEGYRFHASYGADGERYPTFWAVDHDGQIWRLKAGIDDWGHIEDLSPRMPGASTSIFASRLFNDWSTGSSFLRNPLASLQGIRNRELWTLKSGGVFRSTDQGSTWSSEVEYHARSIALSPDGLTTWVAGSEGILLQGEATGSYPQVLAARLTTTSTGQARLEFRIKPEEDTKSSAGLSGTILVKGGDERDFALNQLNESAFSRITRPPEGSDIWSVDFDPESVEVDLRSGENLRAEVELLSGGIRQTFTLPPLTYNPWWRQPAALPLAGYASWLLLLLLTFLLWPAGLFSLQRLLGALNLARFVEAFPYMGSPAKLFLEAAGVLPLLVRTPRALDAWVEKHRSEIRKRFETEETVLRSSGYVPLPVRTVNQFFDRPEARAFSRFFLRSRTLIQIAGVGGAGKTMLAVQIVRWALAGKEEGGLERKPMIPVLVDEDTEDLRAVVKRKLTSWLQEELSDELLDALLRKQRILVIVDRVSERESTTREHLRTLHGYQSINALMVTTRQPLHFDAGNDVLIHPQPLGSETLLHFMTNLLQDPSRSGAFQTMKGQMNLAQKMADLIRLGEEEIPLTPLLARLYVDKAVELAKVGATLDDLPTSIPDVYFEYLRSVNPPGGLSDPDMLRACEILAELALVKGFVPHEILWSEARKALAGGWKEASGPDFLLQRLRGNGVLQEANVGTEVLLRFALDPVAEFLAAMAHARRCGESISAWKTLALKIDQAGPQASGFRLALRLVCDAYGQRLGWACSEEMSRLTQEPPLP